MTTNKYFTFYDENEQEQNLVDDLIAESIQITGLNFIYIPRQNKKLDLVFGEDVLSHFSTNFEIEMYVKNVDGMGGEGDLISKMGYEIRDRVVLTVNKTRFLEVSKGTGLLRPNEGDLIYFPFQDRPLLLEIMFVEQEAEFHQLNSLYVYDLKCSLFQYSQEEIATTYPQVDIIEDDYKNALVLELSPGGTGTYVVDEIVYQGTSLVSATAQGRVILFDSVNNLLNIITIIGTFDPTAGNVIGNTSAASWVLAVFDDKANINEPLSNNQGIETESLVNVSRTEVDPFSGGNY